MKFLLASNGLSGGGTERVVSLMAHGLQELGQEVAVATSDPPTPQDFPLPAGTPRFPYASPYRLGPLSPLLRVARLRRHLRAWRPDLLIALGESVNLPASLAALGLPTRVAWALQTNPALSDIPGPWVGLNRLFRPLAHVVSCPTEALRRELRHRRLVTIPNPLVVEPLPPPVAMDSGVILAVGRLDDNKNQAMLLDAFQRSQLSGWRIRLCGTGPNEGALREQAARLGIPVELAGQVTDVDSAYRQADVLCLTSRHEGFGLVLAEAMRHGLTVISSDCPYGPAEIIQDGVTGFLMRRYAREELAGLLRRVCQDRALRLEVGARARNSLGRFELSAVCQAWIALAKASGFSG